MKRGNLDIILLLMIFISVFILSSIAFVVGQSGEDKSYGYRLCALPRNSDTIPRDECGVAGRNFPDTPEVRAAISDWSCYIEEPPHTSETIEYTGFNPYKRCCGGTSFFVFEEYLGLDPYELIDAPNLDIILAQYSDFDITDFVRSNEIYDEGDACCITSTKSQVAWFSEKPYDTDTELCCPISHSNSAGSTLPNPYGLIGDCCYYDSVSWTGEEGKSSTLRTTPSVEVRNKNNEQCCAVGGVTDAEKEERINGAEVNSGGKCCFNDIEDLEHANEGSAMFCNSKPREVNGEMHPTICCAVYDSRNTDSFTMKCLSDPECVEANQNS